jgi:streptogramin lyase
LFSYQAFISKKVTDSSKKMSFWDMFFVFYSLSLGIKNHVIMKKQYSLKNKLIIGLLGLFMSSLLNAQTFTVSTLAGSFAGSVDGVGSAARFDSPQGIAVDSKRNVYVADRGNHTIRKITPGGVVTTLAGTSQSQGFVNANGTSAKFYLPQSVVVDANDNVYVADLGNHRIRKITPNGDVTTFAGNGQYYSNASYDGNGTAATFSAPIGLAIDASGNIYVTEQIGKIRKITPSGDVTTIAGQGGSTTSTDGNGTAATFNQPSGIAVAADGSLYVGEYSGNKIRKIATNGDVTTIAGDGTAGFADGNGSNAKFNGIKQLSIAPDGNIYVADFSNYRVRKVTPTGDVTTFAGSSNPGNTDGDISTATFTYIGGVVPFNNEYIIICDEGWRRIRVAKSCTNATSSSTASACYSYEWNNLYLTSSGTYTSSGLVGANGCDSIATLNLTIYNGSETYDTVTVCGTYTDGNGDTYTESGNYEVYLTNQYGCDSLIYLTLNINSSIEYTDEFMYNSCYPHITFTSSADSVIKINGQELEGSNLIMWNDYVSDNSSYYDYDHYYYNIEDAPDGQSWIPSPNYEGDNYIDVYFGENTYSGAGKFVVYQNLNPGAIKEVYAIVNGEEGQEWISIAQPTVNVVMTDQVTIAEFPFDLQNVVGVELIIENDGLLHGFDAIGLETSQLIYNYPHAATGEYVIEAISKGGCANVDTIQFENNNEYDTLNITSCQAFTYYNSDYDNDIIIGETGIYDLELSVESECGIKYTHLDFTYTGGFTDTNIVVCADPNSMMGGQYYEWEDADWTLYGSGTYTYAFYNEETGCDSVVNLHLTFKEAPSYESNLSESCNSELNFLTDADSSSYLNGVALIPVGDMEGDPVYTVNNLEDGTTYTVDMFSKNGCNTSFTWVNKLYSHETINKTVCNDEFTTPSGGMTLTETGVYQDTVWAENTNECTVIYTINFTNTAPKHISGSFSEVVCAGSTFTATINNAENGINYILYNNTTELGEDTVLGNGSNQTLTATSVDDPYSYQVIGVRETEINAVQLPNSNDFVRFPGVAMVSDTAITIEADVYYSGNNHPWAGQAQFNSDNQGSNSWLWHAGQFYVNDGGTWRDLYFPNVNKTAWVHVATVADKTGMYIYYDGTLVASSTDANKRINTGITNISSATVTLGVDTRYTGDNGRNSSNSFDNLKIWNTSRSSAQIQSDINNQPTGPEAGLLLYNNFDTPLVESTPGGTFDYFASVVGGKGYVTNHTNNFLYNSLQTCESIVSDTLTAIAAPVYSAIDTTIEVCASEYEWVAANEVFTASGSYTRTLESVYGCDSTVTLNLTLIDISKDLVFAAGEIAAVYTSANASYQWIYCDDNSNIDGETAATYLPEGEGEYAVVISEGSCQVTTECYDVIGTATNDGQAFNAFSVYPNPSNGTFSIDLKNNADVMVTNNLGEVIYKQSVEAGTQNIDLSNQAEGVYYLSVGSKVTKIVVAK